MSATAPLATHRSSILIYFLTAAEDEEVCDAIRRHLIPIVRESEIPIELMDDFDAPPGSERTRHQERLLTADIVISLISVDFLDDDTLYKRNQQVIERHNLGQTVMMSVLVRNCMWKVTPFAKLRVLPKNHEPLNNKKYWNSEDDALASVASDIYTSISEITNVVVLPQGPVLGVGGSTGAESVAVEPAAAPVGQSEAVAAEPQPVEAPRPPGADSGRRRGRRCGRHRLGDARGRRCGRHRRGGAGGRRCGRHWLGGARGRAGRRHRCLGGARPSASGGAGAPPVAVSIATPATATLSVHWRKKYYRRVIWKRGAALLLDFTLALLRTGHDLWARSKRGRHRSVDR